ncbi:transcriptional coactivator p15/PC4 family protein [Candidatus Bipolaricaulota bacterium]
MAEEVQATDEVLVRSIDKGMGSRIHVRISKFRDRDYLDIRNFYETDDGEWKPTRKGVAVPVDLYDDLMEALAKAKPEIEKRAAESKEAMSEAPAEA